MKQIKKMKKLKTLIIAAGLVATSMSAQYASAYTIAVVAPIEIKAMHEITDGLQQQLAAQHITKTPIKLIIKNAEGDPELQQSIISQFAKQKQINMVAPIGTSAFEMAAALVKAKPIIGIAAELSDKQRHLMPNKQVTDVLDEIDVVKQLDFLLQVMPGLKQVTIMHSVNAKIAAEVTSFKNAAKHLGIKIQDLAVPEASDLYTTGQHVDKSSQAIFILKDEMIVGGMPSIVQQAEKRKIPVIASDDGSVQNGAAFALGVRERTIGVKSAQVIARIISGVPCSKIPLTKLRHYVVFYNAKHALKQGVSVKKLLQVSVKSGYSTDSEL